jgi:hypothetical protein
LETFEEVDSRMAAIVELHHRTQMRCVDISRAIASEEEDLLATADGRGTVAEQ